MALLIGSAIIFLLSAIALYLIVIKPVWNEKALKKEEQKRQGSRYPVETSKDSPGENKRVEGLTVYEIIKIIDERFTAWRKPQGYE